MKDGDEELPAGRELDARIHEQVFGERAPADGALSPDVPYYSTDLVASFSVARKLKSDGWVVDADNWVGGGASIRLKNPVEEERAFVGKTPAEALCRAALAVYGSGS